jgi:hypothetical protein
MRGDTMALGTLRRYHTQDTKPEKQEAVKKEEVKENKEEVKPTGGKKKKQGK